MDALSARKKSEIKAWEEEIVSCTHTSNLSQDLNYVASPDGMDIH
jgi:uncharacterized UBP type Zn finger protein